MEIAGRFQNGVVVLDSPVSLPEGAVVSVSYSAAPAIHIAKKQSRVEFPIVRSANPGSVHLTNEMIGEVLDDEDASS